MTGVRITLTSSATAYNVFTLASAIDASTPKSCHQVTIQSDFANSAAKINVGDSNVSATRYGQQLLTGGSTSFSDDFNGIQLDNLYVETDTGGAVADIFVVVK